MRFQLKNGLFLGILAFVVTPLTWMILFSDTDLSENSLLEQRLAELRDRLHYAESLNQDRENDVHVLRNQIKVLLGGKHGNGAAAAYIHRYGLPAGINLTELLRLNITIPELSPQIAEESYRLATNQNGSNSQSSHNNRSSVISDTALLQDARAVLANMSSGGSTDLSPPGIYNYLPHLAGKPSAMRPGFKLSRGRMGVSIIMGIPTIKRDRESYLMQTLDSLISNLNAEEREDALIIVFVAEPFDLNYVKAVAKEVEDRFKEHLSSGLLEVVAPSSEFYPSLDNLQETFGDSLERVKWRTKQNLDFSYLMMYARNKGTYYVQLEDDLVTKPNYMTTMKNFAIQQQVDDWVLLEYSKLGFIGKLFKSRDLPMVVEFFLMFHRDKPIDWLLDHLLYVKVCNPEKDRKHCQRSINELRRRFKPSLFQHIGTHSSLAGKVQKLKDKDFGKNVKVQSHLNPNAEVSTSLKVYQHFSLDRAYMGETFFWGLIPEAGDIITFKFNPPIVIEKFLLRSGNAEHPGDKLFNTTVEVLPSEHKAKENGVLSNGEHEHGGLQRSADGFLIIGKFDHETGMASGPVDESVGPIDSMRLRVLTESSSWVILSEIMITPKIKS